MVAPRTRGLRKGGSSGGLYSLTEPEHFSFSNVTGFKNYGGRIFATGTVTFELMADDDRRIIDELSMSGATITQNGNVYTVNLTGDGALNAAYHIQLHDGGDTYTNAENNISVLGSAGDDTISNSGTNVTISAGAGNDEISNTAANVTIDGGEGNNTIFNSGANVSIDVAKGNDVIEFAGANNFTVTGFGAGDVIKPASGNLTDLTFTNDGVVASYRNEGANYDSRVTIGGLNLSQTVNNWSLENGTANLIPTASEGAYLNDGTIAYQQGESAGTAQVAISGIAKLDGLENIGTVIEVDGSAVNDSGATVALNSDGYQFNLIGDWSGKTFTATDNGDVINNSASNITIALGDGDDKLTNFAASAVTITTGGGSDTIEISGNVEAVNITDFSTDDRLEFAAGISGYSYSDGALTVTLTDEQVVTVTGLSAPHDEATWLSVDSGKATYGTPAGTEYSVDNKAITCADTAVVEEFELNGIANAVTVEQINSAAEVDGTTIKINSDAIFDTGKKVTAPDGYAFKIADANGHYAFQDGDNYALATTDNTTSSSNLIRVYEVTLPAFVTVTSGIFVTAGGKTYAAGEITLSGTKTGYSVASTATITADTTITASLDTSDGKHYVFGNETDGYTLADDTNTAAYPDLTQVYKVTLPSGVNVTSAKYAVGTDIYVEANASVTIVANDANKLIKSATAEGGTLTNGVYTLTVTKDLTVSNPILIWDFAKVFASEDGTLDKPYTLDTAEKFGYLTDNVAVGEDYSGKYFKLTSGIGSDVKNIGDETKQFKGTAILGAGVKVSFNGGNLIEVTSGEITFNASNSTFDSLDSGDKFKVGNIEYTVGENCILQSGKVWLNNPAQFTLTELGTENNWTDTVDGTITLTNAETFYGADGKQVASFDGTTLTKGNSATAITAINASALTTAITINGFYNENTTITAGSGGVNVNVDGNKFSVVNGEFKFDGTKLISGTATLSTANDAVKVGNNLITLTSGDGITVNASDSTIGGLNSGDEFTIGSDSYEVATNGIIKNDNSVHATAENLAISSDGWTSATIIAYNAITLGNDTLYIDSTAKQVAKLENEALTAIDTTDVANLTIDVGTGKEYTLGKEFSNLKSGDNSFKVTASGNYKVNGTTITLANVTGIEIDGVNYSVDAEKISKTISNNIYHLTKGETVTTSALTSGDDWKLYSGTVTVTDSLTTTNGKMLTVASDTNGVTVTVANGAITSITGLASGGSVTYDGKTYEHTLTLPDNVTATGYELVIDGKNYYATGTKVTVSGFTSGEISFDASITSLAKSGDDIVAKVGENVALTISGLTYPTENGNDWTVSGNSATYDKKFTGGAIISGKTITYQPASNETIFTLSGLNGTPNATNITVGENKVTINDSALLTNGATITATSGYTVELAGGLAPSNQVSAGWDGTSYYSAAGYKTAGWTLANGKVSQVAAATAAVTVENVPNGATVSNDTIGVSGTAVTVKNAALVGAKITATGYTIGVATDLQSKGDITAGWNGTSYYTTSGSSTDYYTIDNGTVTKVAAVTPAVTVSGVKSNSGLNLNGTTVTVSNASLDGNEVTITGTGYTLALGNDVTKTSTTNAGWTYANNVATYKDS